MNIFNDQDNRILRPALQLALAAVRADRAFNPAEYIQKKSTHLLRYLSRGGLSSCVVAVSGGIDSAVVLGIASRAQKQDGTIKRVVPVLLPVRNSIGATGQDDATSRGKELCHAFGFKPVTLDLHAPHAQVAALVGEGIGIVGEGWAQGQLVSYMRTPTLYYVTSLLSQAGTPGVLLGTTNKDEGAYLGYFGKASDGMVDLQIISDIHKSEVYAVARELGVPASILEVTPTGDMYDGRVDEEIFGAPYDFVELFLTQKQNPSKFEAATQAWGEADWCQYRMLADRLECMHRYNGHKYLGKSPAVHLDLLPSRMAGGWDYYVEPLL